MVTELGVMLIERGSFTVTGTVPDVATAFAKSVTVK
jgi:hypothetical protein